MRALYRAAGVDTRSLATSKTRQAYSSLPSIFSPRSRFFFICAFSAPLVGQSRLLRYFFGIFNPLCFSSKQSSKCWCSSASCPALSLCAKSSQLSNASSVRLFIPLSVHPPSFFVGYFNSIGTRWAFQQSSFEHSSGVESRDCLRSFKSHHS